jgi:thymidylate synthase (FAD)
MAERQHSKYQQRIIKNYYDNKESISLQRLSDGRSFPCSTTAFVCLVDVMGDDQAVVQAARVSYGEGTRKVSDDRGLIRYLLRHRHTTPFEMAELKFLVRVPMDCWRQWIRHRTANVNEYSTRYSLAIDAMQATRARRLARRRPRTTARGAGGAGRRAGPAALGGGSGISGRSARELYDSGSSWGWRGNKPARICRCRPTPKPIGRSTCTICCTFLALRMDQPRAEEIRSTPRRSASGSCGRCSVGLGSVRRLSIGGMFLSRLEREVIERLALRLAESESRATAKKIFWPCKIRVGPPWPARANGTNAAKSWSAIGCKSASDADD